MIDGQRVRKLNRGEIIYKTYKNAALLKSSASDRFEPLCKIQRVSSAPRLCFFRAGIAEPAAHYTCTLTGERERRGPHRSPQSPTQNRRLLKFYRFATYAYKTQINGV